MTTRTALSGSFTDMTAVIGASAVGDTILIPAGTFNVSQPILAFDGLTIKGAGIGLTTLVGQTDIDWQPILQIDGTKNLGQPIELSGITFQGKLDIYQGTNRTTDLTSNWSLGVIIQGGARNVRVHDCRFTKFNHGGLIFRGSAGTHWGFAWGVVWNCQFYDIWAANIGYGVEVTGDPNNWTNYPTKATLMGVVDGLFIEDNDMQLCRHFVAASNGAIYTARNNSCKNNYPNAAFFDMHGQTSAWPRGTRWRECYNNTLANPDVAKTNAGLDARGGGGVTYGNTVTGNGVGRGVDMFLEQPIPVGQGYPATDQVGNPDGQYIYNNNWAGAPDISIRATTGGIQPASFWFVEGRDYFRFAPPGYVAFTYPHPLRPTTAQTASAALSSVGVFTSSAALKLSARAAPSSAGQIVCDALPLQVGVAQVGQGFNLASGASFAPSTTQSGATLVVIAGVATLGARITGVSDSNNGAYTLAAATPQTAGRPGLAVFYKTGSIALDSTDAITVTTSAGSYNATAIALPAGSAYDVAQIGIGLARQSLPLALPGAGQPTEILVGGTQLDAAGGAFSEAAGFTSNTDPGGSLFFSGYRNALALPSGAAQWLSLSVSRISSLDTGRISTAVAWGGEEFGYAYTYTLSGAPAGVTIDIDSGMLSVAIPLPVVVGGYTFNVIATNRENGKSATFPITLNVIQGVTQNWVAGQVLHQTYDPHNSANFGSPSGSDWTNVLLAIQTAIIQDQVAVGDEMLRATIPFHRGAVYQYRDNHWTRGIQYYDVTATGSGAKPVLQCINNDLAIYNNGPLNIGWPGSIKNDTVYRSNSCLIQSVAAGASTVTLVTPSQAARIKLGRWHAILGGSIQIGGEPPNVMTIDYVKVTAVNGSTGAVTLDRPLGHKYSSTWYEDASDNVSIGRAWLVPWDSGGAGGWIPADPRLSLRGRWFGVEFRINTNGVDDITYADGHIQLDFDTCLITNPQISMSKHVALYNCVTTRGGEPDKMTETILFDGCTTGILGGATGYLYWLSRNSTHGCLQISPREFRALNSTFDPAGDTFLQIPISFSFNGALWNYDIENCTFKPNINNPTLGWTFTGHPSSDDNMPVVIGTDATWSGNQLRIPRGFARFENWLTGIYEGSILSVAGNAPVAANWGYVNNVTSPGDGTALWLDVTWVNGSKPLSGNLYPSGRARRLRFLSNTFVAPMDWSDPQFASEQASPNANWDFPAGYPKSVPLNAATYAPNWATAGNVAALLVGFTSSGGPTIATGSATLAGAGTLASTAQLRLSARAALGSVGSASSPAQMIAAAGAGLIGSGATGSAAGLKLGAVATLLGAGAISGAAFVQPQGVLIASAALSGTGFLGADATLPPPNLTGPLLLIAMGQFTSDPGTPFDTGAFFAPLSEGRSVPFADVNYATQIDPVFISWSPVWPVLTNASARVLTFTLNASQQLSAGLVGNGSFTAGALVAPVTGAAIPGAGALACDASHLCPAVAMLVGSGTAAGDAQQIVHATPPAAAILAGSSSIAASAVEIAAGAATLAGSGFLIATPIMRGLCSAALRGNGVIACDAGLVHFSPAAALIGTSQLIGGATQIVYNAGAVQLDGICALSVDPVIFLGNALYLMGEGFINAQATVVARGRATCGGVAVLVAASIPLRATAALLVGSGLLSASAAASRIALARIDGVGTALAPGALRASATATILAFGDLHVQTSKQLNASALASGFGNLFLTASSLVLRTATVALVGSSTAFAAAALREAARALLGGTSGLQADGFIGQTFFAEAALDGAGTLASDGQRAIFGIGVLAGAGSVAGGPVAQLAASATLAGLGAAASSSFSGVAVAARLVGQGTVVASINFLRPNQVELDGAGMLAATAAQRVVANATLAGRGTLKAAVTYFISAALVSAGQLTADSSHDSRLAIALTGDGEFDGAAEAGFIVYHANATPNDEALATVVGQDYPIAA